MKLRLLFAVVLFAGVACSLGVNESDYVGGKRAAGGTSSSSGGASSSSGGTSGDGGDSSIPLVDDFDAGPKCSVDTPFGSPVVVPGLEAEKTGAPRLSRDELTIYFHNDASANPALSMHYATRGDRNASFGASAALPVLPSAYGVAPMRSSDGRFLFFGSTPTNTVHLFMANGTDDPNTPFSLSRELNKLSTQYGEDEPYLTADGTELYFMSFVVTNGSKILRAKMDPSTGLPIGDGELVTGLGGPTQEIAGSPVLTYDGLTMYFSSSRDGGIRLFRATRATKSDAWGNAQRVAEVTSDSTWPGFISPDNCRLYVHALGANGHQPFVLSRVP